MRLVVHTLPTLPTLAALASVALTASAPGCAGSSNSSGDDGGLADVSLSEDAAGAPAPGADAAGTACVTTAVAGPGLVVTDRGPVRGAQQGNVWAYKNVPYAAPPVGPLRWKPPQPPVCWSAERDATAWGPQCPQSDAMGTGPISGSEDCLQLNVWSPATATTPLPVMVWIHGGGNALGSAVEVRNDVRLYEGDRLAQKQNVVVVTLNYRLGHLGHFAHVRLAAEDPHGSTGNYGVLDMIAALAWVKTNASRFGGDPGNVTIFGESAGGLNVCTLLASPLAKGLFHRAIIESGGCAGQTVDVAQAGGAKLVTAATCDGPDPIGCLRALPAEAVVAAVPVAIEVAGATPQFHPVVDGHVLIQSPLVAISSGMHNKVPTIVGTNSKETSRTVPIPRTATAAQYEAAVRALVPGAVVANRVLAQYPVARYPSPWDAYVALTSDAKFVCSARRALRALAGSQTSAYRYSFAHALDNAPLLAPFGAWHGVDVLYVFDHLALAGYVPGAGDTQVADTVMSTWGRFARTGNPNQPGSTAWPAYDAATDRYWEIDTAPLAKAGLRTAECDFWDSLGP